MLYSILAFGLFMGKGGGGFDGYDLCLPPSDERKRPSEPSKPAERKTNCLKRKDLRSACVSKSQVFVCYSVPIEYVVILVCSTMPIRTCVERFTSAPIDYG